MFHSRVSLREVSRIVNYWFIAMISFNQALGGIQCGLMFRVTFFNLLQKLLGLLQKLLGSQRVCLLKTNVFFEDFTHKAGDCRLIVLSAVFLVGTVLFRVRGHVSSKTLTQFSVQGVDNQLFVLIMCEILRSKHVVKYYMRVTLDRNIRRMDIDSGYQAVYYSLIQVLCKRVACNFRLRGFTGLEESVFFACANQSI